MRPRLQDTAAFERTCSQNLLWAGLNVGSDRSAGWPSKRAHSNRFG